MKEPSVEALFDEFALAYRRGERLDVLAYLERVPEGAERDALAGLIDRLLQAVPAREPAEEEVVLMQARLDQEAPLIVLRRRRSLGRQAVVDALVRALRLDPGKREKVAGYYHRLETGLLDPEPVDASVWDALSEVLRANARALAAAFQPPPPTAAPAHRRADEGFALATRRGAVAADQPDLGPDEVDRLFTGSA